MSLSARFLFALGGVVLVGCAPITADNPEVTTTDPTDTPTAIVANEPSDPDFQGQILPITATAQVVGRDQTFALEVAKTPEQQALGLMFREFLPDDRGMLFEFNPPRPVSFWMKNCLINLDMIFLRDGVIQAIAHDVPPCETEPCPSYGPPRNVNIDQVIEIRGGLAAEIGLSEGDQITVTHQEN
ncbi:DUF192 domain-containing protein [Picosynechococcus sp. NKBG15041c]|uniref:DUF192 domain-containing protein n=1 Tax=Picosynechococcus sp. NKBG15041c TaxID=1407650 RepID=UPI00041FB766|nr:DUF192 domain-containing protein [Picosynechococcus sp. NKBG15041c]